MYAFAVNIVSTVVGGLLLALLVFLITKRIRPLPNIDGCWRFETATKTTSYGRFKNMILGYESILFQRGNSVYGTVEKIYENSSEGEREYIGKYRIQGKIDGHIDKKYLGKNQLTIQIIEEGEIRKSTWMHKLNIVSKCHMEGTFESTAAKQSGSVSWRKC